jgi:hypothetical protein
MRDTRQGMPANPIQKTGHIYLKTRRGETTHEQDVRNATGNRLSGRHGHAWRLPWGNYPRSRFKRARSRARLVPSLMATCGDRVPSARAQAVQYDPEWSLFRSFKRLLGESPGRDLDGG